MSAVLRLTWAQFDEAADAIAAAADVGVCCVYGVPRGGLALAVALSHRLRVPLEQQPGPGTLIVDDVIETGRTLRAHGVPFARVWTWVAKGRPEPLVRSVIEVAPSTWVIFPWEDAARAEIERREYAARQ